VRVFLIVCKERKKFLSESLPFATRTPYGLCVHDYLLQHETPGAALRGDPKQQRSCSSQTGWQSKLRDVANRSR